MSHQLTLPGCPYPLYPTSTDFTWRMVRARPRLDREAILRAYFNEVVMPKLAPPELQGKDARNAYLQAARDKKLANIRSEHYTRILTWLRDNPKINWEET